MPMWRNRSQRRLSRKLTPGSYGRGGGKCVAMSVDAVDEVESRPALADGEIDIRANVTYSKHALARQLRCSGRQIERWMKQRRGRFPRPFYVGRTPYWRGTVVLDWMNRRQQEAMI
jgi:predicted DNA-binding transcriptional regulator AlpA